MASALLSFLLTSAVVSLAPFSLISAQNDVGSLAGKDQRSGSADATPCTGEDDGLFRKIVWRLRHSFHNPNAEDPVASPHPRLLQRLYLSGVGVATIRAFSAQATVALRWQQDRCPMGKECLDRDPCSEMAD